MDERRDKMLRVATALLEHGESLGLTALNKAMFYLDLVALRDTGELASGCTYIALQRGPVVAHYAKRLVPPLVDLGFAESGLSGISFLKRHASLSSEDLEVSAANVAGWVSTKTAAWLSEFSHKNLGWKMAYRDGKPKSINMLIAMQQVADSDPWLTEPMTPQAIALLEKTTDGAVPWM